MSNRGPFSWGRLISSRAAAALSAALVLCLAASLAGAQQRAPSLDEGRRVLAAASAVGHYRLQPNMSEGFALDLLGGGDQPIGTLVVHRRSALFAARFQSRHYTYEVFNAAPGHEVVAELIHGAHAVAAWDGGPVPGAPRARGEERQYVTRAALAMVLLALVMAALRGGKVSLDLRLPHVIQVCTQSSIYLYWMLYYPAVIQHLPTVAAHLVLGVAADAFFCFARFRSWRVGLSALPVVLSINLFEWFDWRGAILAIVVAFGSKAYVHRGGKHVFNPSVAGLTVVGILSILVPDSVHFGSAFHTLNIPPNMAEWVLLVAFVGQMRFRVSPVAIAAAIALRLAENPAIMRPSIIIAMTLLAADPATTPRSDLGKMLFGAVLGFGLPTLSIMMRALHQPDDFAKVMAVAVANALAPALDVVAAVIVGEFARLRGRTGGFVAAQWKSLAPRVAQAGALARRPLPNYAFVAVWLLICASWLRVEKPLDFEPALHWNLGTPLVVFDADGVPRCASNPVFCRPFTFPQEAAMWWHRLRAPG
ncbi:MAG: Sel1 domain protein repeat-containing protein [Myxococcaceae bacterium]|nr:Sel1 domain protein repeat-containing protein [Myxococcaceae bacterium]